MPKFFERTIKRRIMYTANAPLQAQAGQPDSSYSDETRLQLGVERKAFEQVFTHRVDDF